MLRVAVVALAATAARGASRDIWPPAAYAQANATLAQLTTEEKVALCSGNNLAYATCGFRNRSCSYVGYIAGIPRLNLSPIYLEDGPQGVADTMKGVTQWPSLMTLAQAWRPELMQRMGEAMGAEQVVKGSNVMLGPSVALVRVPMSGRNFEYFSEDPFLNAALAGPMVKGIQSNNISACVKHWIFNSQETQRNVMSSNVPERVGRELYEAPYKAAVDAGVGSVMCSFNVRLCPPPPRSVSDWGAQHGTTDFALGGLDMEQEWVKDAEFYGAALAANVANGSIPMARLDDMARRILLPMYALNYAAPGSAAYGPNATANSTEHSKLAAMLSAATPVLLKNDKSLLPLSFTTTARILIVGSDDITGGGGSGQVVRPFTIKILDAAHAAFPSATLTYLYGPNCSAAAAAAAAADVAIVLVNVWGSEGMDRANLSLGCGPNAGGKSCQYYPDQDDLVAAVAAAAPATVVVVRAPGAVLMPWLGSVRAVVYQLFGGQDANYVLAALLNGGLVPAGKLTVSFPRSMEDTWLSWPADSGPINPASWPGTDRGGGFPEVDYSEGLQVGYRWYTARNTTPLFCFGHGISYVDFDYSSLTVSGALSPATPTTNVSFTLALGSGGSGAEVAQLYVAGLPGDPPMGLKGFQYIPISQQQPTVRVTIALALADLSYWSVEAHARLPYPPGVYRLWVGSSSCDLRLAGSVAVSAV